MIPAAINIPISFLKSPVSWGTKEAFCRLKVGPAVIKKEDCPFTPQRMRVLLSLKWVSTDGSRYFIRSWAIVDRLLGGDGSKVKISDRDKLFDNFEEVIFTTAGVYLHRIQPDRQNKNAQRNAGKSRLQFGIHSGGVSLSLIGSFFGKNAKCTPSSVKQWACRMRRRCEKKGISHWHRRFVQVTNKEGYQALMGAEDENHTGGYFQEKSGYWREVASSFTHTLKLSFFSN